MYHEWCLLSACRSVVLLQLYGTASKGLQLHDSMRSLAAVAVWKLAVFPNHQWQLLGGCKYCSPDQQLRCNAVACKCTILH
jgi:hypothetical protein